MMRAKMTVRSVEMPYSGVQRLSMSAVTSKPFDAEGNSEDNTYARYTPTASLTLDITNPSLHGKFEQGDTFYVDFTRAE
jgi:hypothetical protein